MSVRALPKELQEKAITELDEVPSRIQEDIKYIREWSTKQPHLKINNDDQWILSFLRSCKFSLQRTKEKLDYYYTLRSLSPELFPKENPLTPEIKTYFTYRLVAILPNSSNLLSPKRFFSRAKNCDPEKVTLVNALSAVLMLVDVLIYSDDSFIINGQEIIIDCEDLNYAYVAQLTPAYLKKVVTFLQDAYPNRIKGIYFLNVASFLQVAFNIIVSFLTEKLKKRIHVYSKNNFEEFYQHVPRSVLPQEYGGYAGSFDELADKLDLFVKKQYDWLVENSKYGCDETKRPEKSKVSQGFTSTEGSFRKLEID